jgi:hypothetical protein
VSTLNRTLRGWANYFQRCCREQHRCKNSIPPFQFIEQIIQLASGSIRSRQVPLIDIAAFVPHGELAKHQAGKPVEIRRGRATVIDPNFSSTVESQTSFVITIARTGRAIPGG